MSPSEYVDIEPAAVPALDYPGTPARASGVLDGDRFWIGRELDRLDDRTMVLAVGSNAAPSVLADKLRRVGVTGSVGMVRTDVAGLAVGYSAHVSRRGYIPAGPYAAAGHLIVVGLWLTEPQRAAIDATEPNYHRLELHRDDYPLRVELGEPPASYGVYVSRRGVLAVDGVPLPLGTQRGLFARLAGVAELATLAPWNDAEAAARALTDPAVQVRIRDGFVAAGWVAHARIGSAGQAVDPVDRQP
ncbi:MAG: hypothetical protein ACRDPQ_21895 [Nocardioidaceae bacterium]